MSTERILFKRIGPGLITAAVVLGPGSIVASSRAGAEAEYGLVWVLLLACLFMAIFTSMGARLGCALPVTPLQYVAERWGRALAALAGLSAFLVTAGFQFGNNIGVSVAMTGVTGIPLWVWPLAFTGLSLFFLLRARNVYQWLEKMMMVLVSVMIVAFVANLFWTGIHPGRLTGGLMPKPLTGNQLLILPAMLATTFSAVAAFYQAYLVRSKGWRRENVRVAIGDAWIGIAILGTIALTILIGAAETLFKEGGDFGDVGELAKQLQGVLGPWATGVFCLGLAAASFSSFIANALIGGVLMADGLGQYTDESGVAAKVWTALVMVAGCAVAEAVLVLGQGGTTSLLIAQASTLVAAPLCAILLYALTSSWVVMGDLRNRAAAMLLGASGLIVMAWLNLGLFRRLIGV